MIPLLLSVFLITSYITTPVISGEFHTDLPVFGNGTAYVTLLREEGKIQEIRVNGKEFNGTTEVTLHGFTKISIDGKGSPGSRIFLGIYQGKRVCAGEEIEIELTKPKKWDIWPWALFAASMLLIYLVRRWGN